MSRGGAVVAVAVVLAVLATPTECWDTKEMEMFDLVEEVNQNFYEVMGISQVSGFLFFFRFICWFSDVFLLSLVLFVYYWFILVSFYVLVDAVSLFFW